MRELVGARTTLQKCTILYTTLLFELLVCCIFWRTQDPENIQGLLELNTWFDDGSALLQFGRQLLLAIAAALLSLPQARRLPAAHRRSTGKRSTPD